METFILLSSCSILLITVIVVTLYITGMLDEFITPTPKEHEDVKNETFIKKKQTEPKKSAHQQPVETELTPEELAKIEEEKKKAEEEEKEKKKLMWVPVPGQLKQISFNGPLVCGVNNMYKAYCKKNRDRSSGDWGEIGRNFENIVVNGNTIYGLYAGQVYEGSYGKFEWTNKQFKPQFIQIDTDGEIMCGIHAFPSKGKVMCKSNDELNDNEIEWTDLKGNEMKYIAVNKGEIYGIDNNNDVYYKEDMISDWKKIDNIKLQQLDLDDENICGLDLENNLYCKEIKDGNWVKIENLPPDVAVKVLGGIATVRRLNYISLNNGSAFGLRSNSDIHFLEKYRNKTSS